MALAFERLLAVVQMETVLRREHISTGHLELGHDRACGARRDRRGIAVAWRAHAVRNSAAARGCR